MFVFCRYNTCSFEPRPASSPEPQQRPHSEPTASGSGTYRILDLDTRHTTTTHSRDPAGPGAGGPQRLAGSPPLPPHLGATPRRAHSPPHAAHRSSPEHEAMDTDSHPLNLRSVLRGIFSGQSC